jgi:hypothetical protein
MMGDKYGDWETHAEKTSGKDKRETRDQRQVKGMGSKSKKTVTERDTITEAD